MGHLIKVLDLRRVLVLIFLLTWGHGAVFAAKSPIQKKAASKSGGAKPTAKAKATGKIARGDAALPEACGLYYEDHMRNPWTEGCFLSGVMGSCCQCSVQPPVTLAPLPSYVKSECIGLSLSDGENLKAKRLDCQNENDTPIPARPICRTENYVNFVTRWVNKALSCLQSFRDKTNIDFTSREETEEFFAILNHESRFQINLQNPGGMGIMQTTGDIANRLGEARASGPNIENPLISNDFFELAKSIPNCHEFTEYGRWDGKFDKDRAGNVRYCQQLFVGPNLSPSRNMAAGMFGYLEYRLTMRQKLKDLALTEGVWVGDAFAKFERVTTRAAYNKGPGVALPATAAIMRTNKKKGLGISRFVELFERHIGFDYVSSVKKDMELLKERAEIAGVSCP